MVVFGVCLGLLRSGGVGIIYLFGCRSRLRCAFCLVVLICLHLVISVWLGLGLGAVSSCACVTDGVILFTVWLCCIWCFPGFPVFMWIV